MTRLVLLAHLGLVACSSQPDRAAGKYQSADGKGPIIELRADGSLDIDPVTDDRCHDAPNLAACRAKQRWSRDGTKLTLERAALATRRGSLGLGGDGDDTCHCTLERTEATFDADTISVGKARAVRVR